MRVAHIDRLISDRANGRSDLSRLSFGVPAGVAVRCALASVSNAFYVLSASTSAAGHCASLLLFNSITRRSAVDKPCPAVQALST